MFDYKPIKAFLTKTVIEFYCNRLTFLPFYLRNSEGTPYFGSWKLHKLNSAVVHLVLSYFALEVVSRYLTNNDPKTHYTSIIIPR